MDIRKAVIEAVIDTAGLEPDTQISLTDSVVDLRFDSIDFLHFVFTLEDLTKTKLDNMAFTDFAGCKTLEDVVNVIERCKTHAAA